MQVSEYVSPEKFDLWQKEAEGMGFLYVASGALVRSSYRAGEFFIDNILEKRGEGTGGKKNVLELGGEERREEIEL